MKQPSLAKLQSQVTAWNTAHPIGTPVTRYKLIDPLADGSPTKTRSEAWIMGGHSAMVMVEGVAGGVCLESVVPIGAFGSNLPCTCDTPTPAPTSHTPGPWRYVAEVPDWCRVSMGDGIVAEVTGGEAETCTANARLIAAAPELLAALKASTSDLRIIVNHNRTPGNKRTTSEVLLVGMECHIANAEVAIAKANGAA